MFPEFLEHSNKEYTLHLYQHRSRDERIHHYSAYHYYNYYTEGMQNYTVAMYELLAEVFLKYGVKGVGGPICSGALIAQSISQASLGYIQPHFIRKPELLYMELRHRRNEVKGKLIHPWVMVDDIINSGESIISAVNKSHWSPPAAIVYLEGMASNVPNDIPVYRARICVRR